MKLNYVVVKNDRRRVVWHVLAAFVVECYLVAIVPIEGLCYLVTGAFSRPLLMLAALFASFYVVRALVHALETPMNQLPVV